MQNAILIAEKPSLRREIEAVYEKVKDTLPYRITCFTEQRGHIVAQLLPDELDDALKTWSWDTLPFHPEYHGGWKLQPIKEKKQGNFKTSEERYEFIKNEIKSGKYDFIINAGDPDQEGELLIRLPLALMGNTLPVKRFWESALTEKDITRALINLRDDDNDPDLVNLYAAARGRQHSDYRYGTNITRALSMRLNGKVNAGRVMTPIMALVCQREQAIANFVPKTVYGVQLTYDKGDGFTGDLIIPSDEDPTKKVQAWYDEKAEAELILSQIGDKATVKSVERKRETVYAPKQYTLATLQEVAGKMGFRADEVLEIAQSLYEAKILSYPRTSCEYLPVNDDFESIVKTCGVFPELAPYVNNISKDVFAKVRATKKWVNDDAVKKEGHPALRPTEKMADLSTLTDKQQKIYYLVCRQFLAMFLPPLLQDKTVVECEANGREFRSGGKIVVDKGFMNIFGTKMADMELPDVKEGDVLDIKEKTVSEKISKPPVHFTDGELVKTCENPLKYLDDERLKKLGKELKLGTAATRAGIIDKLITRDNYLMRKKSGGTELILPTEMGMSIYENIKDIELCKVDMTGIWEEKLQDIKEGKLDLNKFEADMINDVNKLVAGIKVMPISVVLPNSMAGLGEVVGTCPICGKNVVEGKNSYFCEGYKEKTCGCGIFKEINGAKISKDDAKKLLNGESISKSMTSKTKFKWVQKLKLNNEGKVDFVQETTPYICPKCGKYLIDKSATLSCECGYAFWKTVAGKSLSDGDIYELFTKGRTGGKVSGFKSSKKKGKTFSATLIMNPDGTVKFDF